MNPRGETGVLQLIDEAARLICDEGYADYRVAKLKAAERLGVARSAHLVDNTRIEAAVLERQALFGGEDYRRRLRDMRTQALRVMKLLSAYEPRLAGSAVSGAIGEGHRVQIHLVADQPELVEVMLHDRSVVFEQDERRYRLADGRETQVPLLCMEADSLGVDLAVFDPDSLRNPPLSQVDGKPARRLSPTQVQALLLQDEVPRS
ncbi:MAG: hypothetical protein ACT4PZ_03025 [Panacagrimonas sp.]